MISQALCVLLMITAPTYIHAYSKGAPEGVCDSMEPQHHTTAQNSHSPYTISVSPSSIKAGETVTVTLSGNNNLKFKGYFVQARVGDTAIGKFAEGANIKTITCNNSKGSAATHPDSTEKSSVVLKWTAPAGLTESVKFRVTFVKDGATYWVGQESNSVRVV